MFLSETLQHNKINLNYFLFAIAKLCSRIVLRKLTNENSAIFRTVEINYKKLRKISPSDFARLGKCTRVPIVRSEIKDTD